MEFVVNNECFNRAISDVSKIVSPKSALPILSGIKIVANHNELILIGSNADLVIEKKIPLVIDGKKVLEVYETGCVVLSAKFLSEIAKKLPTDIHLTVCEQQKVTIQSGEIVTRLNGIRSDEYPLLPQIDDMNYMKIPRTELIQLVRQTTFAVSKNDSRPVLTGVNLVFNENFLSFIATNSHRLALRKLPIETGISGSFVVPSTSLNELIRLINNESSDIKICLSNHYIVFQSNTFSLYSRLIEGNYPNVSGLLPKEFKTIISLNTTQLLKGIDRACIFASEWRNNNVNLEIKEDRMKISSNSTEIGRIEETQIIKMIEGEANLSISLDGSFLVDALKEEEIKLSFSGSMRPVLLEPIGNAYYLHLISPVRSY